MAQNASLRMLQIIVFGRLLLIRIVQNYSHLIFSLFVINLLAGHMVYTVQVRYFRLKFAVPLRILREPEMFWTI